MASIDTNRSTTAPLMGLAAPIARLLGALRAWNDARITRRALEKLSARELDDIGLSRGDIDLIVARGSSHR